MDTLAQDLVFAVRLILIPLGLYCLSWGYTGFVDLLRGNFWPVPLYRAAIASFAILTLGFQITYFVGMEEVGSGPWSLVWLMFAFAGHVFACAGRMTGHFNYAEKFYWLLSSGHIRVALAMADYHAAFPEEAEALADKLTEEVATKDSQRHADPS